MLFFKDISGRIKAGTAVLLILSGLTLCSDNSGTASGTADDEVINLDYSTHKIDEKLVWLTNNSERLIASPDAKKGGTINLFIKSFPLTFRTVGPDSNSYKVILPG